MRICYKLLIPLATADVACAFIIGFVGTWPMAGITLLPCLLSIILAQCVARRISRPITEISAWAQRLAEGDVNIEAMACPKTGSRDEICILVCALREMAATLKEQEAVLSSIAGGDYSVSIPIRSKHDILNQAVNRIIEQNNGSFLSRNPSPKEAATAIRADRRGLRMLEPTGRNKALRFW